MNPYPVITSWPCQPGRFVIISNSPQIRGKKMITAVVRTFGDPFRSVILAGTCIRRELCEELNAMRNERETPP